MPNGSRDFAPRPIHRRRAKPGVDSDDTPRLGLVPVEVMGPDAVLEVQRTAGNRATEELIRAGGVAQRDDAGAAPADAGTVAGTDGPAAGPAADAVPDGAAGPAGAAGGPAPDAEAARIAALETSYQNSVRDGSWYQAAMDLNGFNDADIGTKVAALNHVQLVALDGAGRHAMPMWHQRVTSAIANFDAEADRVGSLTNDYESALSREDWDAAIVALNGFNDMDIVDMLGRLQPDQLKRMKSAAEDTPVGGGRMARLVNAAAGVDVTIKADEQVGGQVYGVRGGYTYELRGTSLVVSVGMDFDPDRGVTVPVGEWFGYINDVWNHFSLINQDNRAEKFDLEFLPFQGSGHDIQVSSGNGRANAGHYYKDASDNGNAVPHEFGHLIGLQDEYERDAADYQAVTGDAPTPGDGAAEAATAIATEIHDALFQPAEHWYNLHRTRERQRMAAVNAVLAAHHIAADYQNSRNAADRQVSIEYAAKYGHEMSVDFMDRIDTDNDEFNTWREQVLGTFQVTSTSIMGDMSVDHAHAVEPRHVRDFAGYVQQALARGTWLPERDH